jgi:hypothetical protein
MKTAVVGATGTQGGEVAHALLARGEVVRALVRDRHSPASMALQRMGAEIAEVDLDDADSLHIALPGTDALFSVQLAPGSDPDIERRQARILMAAARAAGIRHVVHSSVSNTGAFDSMAGWVEGRWERNYWESKRDAEDHVRHAGFPTYSILRPAFMMDNFAIPKAQRMFPDLAEGKILTAIEPETPMVLIAAEDIGIGGGSAYPASDRRHFDGCKGRSDQRAYARSGDIGRAWAACRLGPEPAMDECRQLSRPTGRDEGAGHRAYPLCRLGDAACGPDFPLPKRRQLMDPIWPPSTR